MEVTMRRLIPDPSQPERAGHQSDPEVSQQLAFWLGRVTTGKSRRVGAVDLAPLVHAGPHGEPFALLHDALASGQLEVAELRGGVVNTVTAHNRGERPVLLLEGESIVGAKQDRVVTLDVIVGPGEEVAIPVGCVERGRWRHMSPTFRSADTPVEPKIRRETSREMRACGEVNQARLWRSVEEKLVQHRVASETANYHDYVARMKSETEAHMKDAAPVPNQVGVLALMDGDLLGLDLLGCPSNWASLSDRLVKTYVLAGLDAPVPAGGQHAEGPSEAQVGEAAEGWLRRAASAACHVRRGVGRGLQLGLEGPGLGGGGLWWESHVAHLAVFGG
jgi:hypothetical protein